MTGWNHENRNGAYSFALGWWNLCQWDRGNAGYHTFPVKFPSAAFGLVTSEFYSSHHGENSNCYNLTVSGFNSDRYTICYFVYGI